MIHEPAPNTHTRAGVLDFTAVEGTIAVPLLVARNLFGPEAGASQERTVAVTYRRLQKGRACADCQSHRNQ